MSSNHVAMTHDMSSMNMTTENSFCHDSMGGGMIMYMDGFHFGLGGGQPCLNLFFSSWTLDTRFKYTQAILGVFVLGILVEASGKLRQVLLKRFQQYLLRQSAHRNHHGRHSKMLVLVLWRRVGIPGMHAFQALLGYILMLATMTFAVEILLAVVLGLGVGYALFYQKDDLLAEPSAMHTASNPCCQFLQGPRDEQQLLASLATTATGLCCHDDVLPSGGSPDTAPLLMRGNDDRVI